MNVSPNRITGRAFGVGLFFTLLFSVLTVYFGNRLGIYVSAVQIPVLPYVLLLSMVLLINPICRLIRFVRPFSVAETLVVFTMGLVSAGISSFGLTDQLVPVIGGLFNSHWNNDQTEWNRYVDPFVNESYFLSAPGIQERAAAFQQAIAKADADQALYDSSERVNRALQRRDTFRKNLAALESSADAADRQIALSAARKDLVTAEAALRQAREAWTLMAPPDAPPTTSEAAGFYFARLQTARAAVDQRRVELSELQKQAETKVALFRRGLPPSLRAFPGFIPIVGEDDFTSYAARLKRLVSGRKALSHIRSAMASLKAVDAARHPEAGVQATVRSDLEAAVRELEKVSDSTPFEAHRTRFQQEETALITALAETEQEMARLSQEKRNALGSAIKDLESDIRSLDSRLKKNQKELTSVTARRELASRNLEVTKNVELLVAHLRLGLASLATRPAGESRDALKSLRLRFPSIDATFARYMLGDVPWSDWMGPLLRWGGLIGLTYLMLLTFNVLIFRQWAYNEKLIYPLAELPELLAGHNDASTGWVPEIFRSGLFWVGFMISGLTLGWNLLCQTGLAPGLTFMDLTGSWKIYITNTPLQGLLPTAKSAVFFTMIGLTFLIPTKVSFSLWFFSVLYMLQLLIMVGMNLGVNESSFPMEWWYTFNFRTAEGGGALLVFATVVLWKCRRYLLCAFMPAVTKDLEPDERRELRFSSVLFLASFTGITLILWRGLGANLGFTLFSLFIILVITIGLVRAVTEGGLLGFQAWVSPFHFIRTFPGMAKASTSASLFAPLMVYYSVLFLDIKTFIAPAMANSLKVRDDLRLSRARFHGLMAVAILSAVVISLVTAVILSYSQGRGADQMNNWFFTSFPKSLFDKIASMTKNPPLPAPGEAGWVIFGGGLMAALLYFRQSLFWMPHPIGLVMLVNPIMRYYWFSIFLGWAAKSVVTRYGGKNTYIRVRGLFIGLIAGELLMVALGTLISVLLDIPIRMDLNRN
ncbi:MAG: DUF6785 family protein [Kiritimatiellia bacterium]